MSVADCLENAGAEQDGSDSIAGSETVSIGGATATGDTALERFRFEKLERRRRSFFRAEDALHIDEEFIGLVSGRIVLVPGQQGETGSVIGDDLCEREERHAGEEEDSGGDADRAAEVAGAAEPAAAAAELRRQEPQLRRRAEERELWIWRECGKRSQFLRRGGLLSRDWI